MFFSDRRGHVRVLSAPDQRATANSCEGFPFLCFAGDFIMGGCTDFFVGVMFCDAVQYQRPGVPDSSHMTT